MFVFKLDISFLFVATSETASDKSDLIVVISVVFLDILLVFCDIIDCEFIKSVLKLLISVLFLFIAVCYALSSILLPKFLIQSSSVPEYPWSTAIS